MRLYVYQLLVTAYFGETLILNHSEVKIILIQFKIIYKRYKYYLSTLFHKVTVMLIFITSFFQYLTLNETQIKYRKQPKLYLSNNNALKYGLKTSLALTYSYLVNNN